MGRHTVHDDNVVMTMLALYEAVLAEEAADYERLRKARDAGDTLPPESDIVRWRSGYGSYELRSQMIRLAYDVEAAWEAMSEDERDGYTFDFEFIPDLLEHVDWTGYSPSMKGDPATIGKLMGMQHALKEEADRRARAAGET